MDILGQYLRRKMSNARLPQADFLNAYHHLASCQGEAAIGELCEYVNVSQRTLNRYFHEHVGMSPKACARVLRLHKRLGALRHNNGHFDAVDGFADQSHWIREFKSLVGVSPYRYFNELHSLHRLEHDYWKHTAVSHYATSLSPVIRFRHGATNRTQSALLNA